MYESVSFRVSLPRVLKVRCVSGKGAKQEGVFGTDTPSSRVELFGRECVCVCIGHPQRSGRVYASVALVNGRKVTLSFTGPAEVMVVQVYVFFFVTISCQPR